MSTQKAYLDRLCAECDQQFGEGTAETFLSELVANGSCGVTLKDKAEALQGYLLKGKSDSEREMEMLAMQREISDVQAETAKIQAEVDQKKARIRVLEQENAALRAEHSRLQYGNTPSGRAGELLAKQGLSSGLKKEVPGDLQGGDQPRTRQQFVEQYNAIENPNEAAAFYNRFSHLLK